MTETTGSDNSDQAQTPQADDTTTKPDTTAETGEASKDSTAPKSGAGKRASSKSGNNKPGEPVDPAELPSRSRGVPAKLVEAEESAPGPGDEDEDDDKPSASGDPASVGRSKAAKAKAAKAAKADEGAKAEPEAEAEATGKPKSKPKAKSKSDGEDEEDEPEPERSWDDLDLPDHLRSAIAAVGWERPTKVQTSTFATMVSGKDIMVQSQTGSGKTGAFCLPWLASRFEAGPAKDTGVQLIVLLPTRELAKQVCAELVRLAVDTPVDVLPVYGGTAMQPQLDALKAGVHAVVGTPGRILDHIRRRSLDLSKVRTVVLDECDEMLSMGFLEDIRSILSACPKQRQTCLFSATVPREIERIARRHMDEPERIELSGDEIAAAEIDHAFYSTTSTIKTRDLLDVVIVEDPAAAIVFCNTREETRLVANVLRNNGYSAHALSSDLTQAAREKVMGRFRDRKLRFLVATDVAARGIDVSHVSHVINYSFPENAEVYVHRTGRTGRAGRAGVALSIVSPQEIGSFYTLTKSYKSIQFTERKLPPKDELAATRTEVKLDRISHDFSEPVSPEWLLLARRLAEDPRGERVVAYLLYEAIEGKRLGKQDEDEDDEDEELMEMRERRSDRDRGPRRGRGRGRDDDRGSRGRGRDDDRGRRGRGRRRRDDEDDDRGRSRGRDQDRDKSRGRRRDEDDDGSDDDGRKRRRTHRSRSDSEAEAKSEPEAKPEAEAPQGDGGEDESKAESKAKADPGDDEVQARESSDGEDQGDDQGEDKPKKRRRRRTRRRSRNREDDDGNQRDDDSDDDSDDNSDDNNDKESGRGRDEGRSEDRPKKRRRRRRRRRKSGGDESADDDDSSAETEGADDRPKKRRRRRRRRRRKSNNDGSEQRDSKAKAKSDGPRVSQDQIVIDIDEQELDEVRNQFGEIDELDELTLKGRRRAVFEELTEEVEVEDLTDKDAASAEDDESEDEDNGDEEGSEDEDEDGDDEESEADESAEAPAAAPKPADGDKSGEAEDETKAKAEAKTEDGSEAKDKDEAEGGAKKKKKRRRRRRRKKAAPPPPELTCPPHKDFWEVWANKYSAADFERPEDQVEEDEGANDNDEPAREPARASAEDEQASDVPLIAEPPAEDSLVRVDLNIGRRHGHKASHVRALLKRVTGLHGKAVKDLTVRDGNSLFRMDIQQFETVVARLDGTVIEEVKLELVRVDAGEAGPKLRVSETDGKAGDEQAKGDDKAKAKKDEPKAKQAKGDDKADAEQAASEQDAAEVTEPKAGKSATPAGEAVAAAPDES